MVKSVAILNCKHSFDDFAMLIQQPEMKGVEVIVVGDHMPPLSDGEDIYPFVRWQAVSWLHFKIKA